jgi:hypothetical protein
MINQNCIHKEIKNRLNLRNTCCHEVQKLLSSQLLSKSIDVQRYNFTGYFNGYETWSVALREEHKFRMFQDRMPRGIFGPKKDGVT